MEKLEVVYNGSCPICSTEVAVYRRRAEVDALPIRFTDLHAADLAAVGLTADQAARRFHVLKNGEILSGIPAFLELWASIPRYRWLGRIVGFPGIRQGAILVYDHLLAPILYGMHKRRVARAAKTSVSPDPSATKSQPPHAPSTREKA